MPVSIEITKMNGLGTYTKPNGDKYVGQWRNNKMDGQGTYAFANGDTLEGQWKDNKIDGQGIYTSSNGDRYIWSLKTITK